MRNIAGSIGALQRETRLRTVPVVDTDVAPVCGDVQYPRLEPGTYEAQCVHATIYRDPHFHAWKALLRFCLLPTGEEVCKFFHMGTEVKPKAGPRSEYRRAWIIANDAQPRRRQTMSARVFKDMIFEITVDYVTKRFDGTAHVDAAIYSTVKRILSRRYP